MKSLLLLVTLLATGCADPWSIHGSGRLVTKELPLGTFDKIEAGGAFHFDATPGSTCSVTITADDNLWEYLDVDNDAGTLRLRMKNFSYQNTHVSAKIVLPALSGVEMDGATTGVLRGITDPQRNLEVHSGGASHLDGELRCKEVKIEVSGASSVDLRGGADVLTLDVGGASHASLADFLTRVTHATVDGASHADVNATGQLDFNVNGASSLTYRGHPAVRRAEVGGASSVHPAD
jgi:hypothetical protein